MSRKTTTQFLNNLLINKRLEKRGIYYASEVTLDYGSNHPKRVDFMQYKPINQMSISGLEKGTVICYEVKSCKEDYHSGNGLNYEGDKNYIVTTMECYKDIVNEVPWAVGIMVAIPQGRDSVEEYDNPTPIPVNWNNDVYYDWELRIIKKAFETDRKRSLTEMLFCMLRAGH